MYFEVVEATGYLAIALLVALGALGGFSAGLLGIGGGAILVPFLDEILQGIGQDPEVSIKVSLATALAVIIFGGAVSFASHHRSGRVDMGLLRGWFIPVVAGAVCVYPVLIYLPAEGFKAIFAIFVIATGLRIGKARAGSATFRPIERVTRYFSGGLIGFLSALVGVGGGAFSSALMLKRGYAIKVAVATSSGLGPMLAVPGTIAYIAAGWGGGLDGLGTNLGYVNILLVAVILPTFLLMAPLGARVAHRLDQSSLVRIFSVYLVVIGVRMLYSIIA